MQYISYNALHQLSTRPNTFAHYLPKLVYHHPEPLELAVFELTIVFVAVIVAEDALAIADVMFYLSYVDISGRVHDLDFVYG